MCLMTDGCHFVGVLVHRVWLQSIRQTVPRSVLIKRETPLCVELHLRHKLTKKHVSLFVCLFGRCVCQGRPSCGWTKRDASQKFKGELGGIKVRD